MKDNRNLMEEDTRSRYTVTGFSGSSRPFATNTVPVYLPGRTVLVHASHSYWLSNPSYAFLLSHASGSGRAGLTHLLEYFWSLNLILLVRWTFYGVFSGRMSRQKSHIFLIPGFSKHFFPDFQFILVERIIWTKDFSSFCLL